jgi:hypothetical protein
MMPFDDPMGPAGHSHPKRKEMRARDDARRRECSRDVSGAWIVRHDHFGRASFSRPAF